MMIKKLLEPSSLYLDKNEQDIIENELKDIIKEIDILLEFCDTSAEFQPSVTPYTFLRQDEIKDSSTINEILSNSKSKNKDGFIVKKIL